MNIDQLNIAYGIPDRLAVRNGEGGLPFIVIQNESATALISLLGGQVLSYRPIDEFVDLLFLSDKSAYVDGKAIRGGIPLCWPWFGPDPIGLHRPNHGFARNHLWSIAETASTDTETRVRLQFFNNGNTSPIWRHAFILTLEITIGTTLGLNLITHNTGTETFSITQALHSYFKVGDVEQIQVFGLDGCAYYDKLAQGAQKSQSGAVTITEEVDRIYCHVRDALVIGDPVLRRRIQIDSPGNETVVVWNPWLEISQKMADLNSQDYKQFICVETGNVAYDILHVPPGAEQHLFTRFKILRDHDGVQKA